MNTHFPPLHRALGEANTHPYPNAFRPKHCNGRGELTCLHDHPGSTDRSPWRWLQGWRTA